MKTVTEKLFFNWLASFCLLLFSLFPCPALTAPSDKLGEMKITSAKHLFDIMHDFNFPSDVSVSRDGKIFVVDGVNNKIKIFNPDGVFISAFGKGGEEDGQFNSPLGIDIDDSDRVFIADSGNHRVQIFNLNGKFLSQFAIPGKNGTPSDPTDVVVDISRNRCYVVDNDNHYIPGYDLSTGKLSTSYGSLGTGKRKFRHPFFITLNKKNYIAIVDVLNTRVQLLNPDGLFVAYVGGWGVEKGQFYRPKGVAVDNQNYLYVSDSFLGVVQVFDADGNFDLAIANFGEYHAKKFKTPVGICIDSRDRLYIVEMKAQKVSVHRICRE